MALPRLKKFLLLSTLLAAAVIASAGSVVYMATRTVEVDWQQDPNKVELHEANRKIRLFEDAFNSKRKGFIRLSEVEINSFMENTFKVVSGASAGTSMELHKSAVLLTGTNIHFVAWLEKPIFGYRIPVVWQRAITPVKDEKGWSFSVQQMKIGQLEIPRRIWPEIEKWIGPIDAVFEEKKDWLAQVPKIALTKNELSNSPEVRLYTFVPENKY
ncbi:MAG: hypothetical protein ACTHMT_16660 [Verrucomicrobiota bacterium]